MNFEEFKAEYRESGLEAHELAEIINDELDDSNEADALIAAAAAYTKAATAFFAELRAALE